MQTTTSANRTAEMIKWLSSRPNIQQHLCRDEFVLPSEECLEIMDALEKQGYYEMIYLSDEKPVSRNHRERP